MSDLGPVSRFVRGMRLSLLFGLCPDPACGVPHFFVFSRTSAGDFCVEPHPDSARPPRGRT